MKRMLYTGHGDKADSENEKNRQPVVSLLVIA